MTDERSKITDVARDWATIGEPQSGPDSIHLRSQNDIRLAVEHRPLYDDNAIDSLYGDDGRDWFLYNSDGDLGTKKDIAKDRSSNEVYDDLDRWW